METKHLFTLATVLCFFWNAEASAQGTATETIGMEINIEPAFSVETTADQAGGNIELGPLLPHGSATQTAHVIVYTNRGQPYRITQHLKQDFQNEFGAEFDPSGMLFSVSNGLHGGQSEVTDLTPVKNGPTVIFTSNRRGDADEFTITYAAKPKKLIPAGRYRAQIKIEGEIQ